jgi:hypothetical protein
MTSKKIEQLKFHQLLYGSQDYAGNCYARTQKQPLLLPKSEKSPKIAAIIDKVLD